MDAKAFIEQRDGNEHVQTEFSSGDNILQVCAAFPNHLILGFDSTCLASACGFLVDFFVCLHAGPLERNPRHAFNSMTSCQAVSFQRNYLHAEKSMQVGCLGRCDLLGEQPKKRIAQYRRSSEVLLRMFACQHGF